MGEIAKKASAEPTRLAWANFALLAVGGLTLLVWIWYFTDWLGTALLLVGLGGVLAWPRSLVGWLPGIGSAVQSVLTRAINSRTTFALLVLAIAGGLIASLFVGSVAVRSLEPESKRRLVFRPGGGLPTARLFAGDSEVRRPFFTSWTAPITVGVQVGGYPATEVVVQPWRRVRLIVPDDLRRPIVLLRPDEDLMLSIVSLLKENAETSIELAVTLPDGSVRTMDYVGRSLWIGCTADCDLPERFRKTWASEHPNLAWRLLTPVELVGPQPRLSAGDRIHAAVTVDGRTFAQSELTVRGGDEPQIEELEI